METSSKGYDFTLSRIQRFCSLTAEWWAPGLFLCILLTGSIPLAVIHPIAACIFLFILAILYRGLLFGLLNLFRDGRTHVEIEDNGVGFGRETADWWIFTDGIIQVRKNRWGTTSIRHHNGTYVDVPTVLLSPDDYLKLENGMKMHRKFSQGK